MRECLAGVTKVCYYALVVDWYSSMSVQCDDCPYNLTSCDNPGCIVGGGIVRPVISANRRTPGPAILVNALSVRHNIHDCGNARRYLLHV